MDTQTAFLLISVTLAVVLYGGWAWWQRRKENQRIEEANAVAAAKRVAAVRDAEAQARYDRTRRAAGLPTASDFTPRRSAPLPAYRATSTAPAPAYSSSPTPAPAYDPYLSSYGAMSSPWHSSPTPSPAPCPSYDSGSSYSSSCDSSSSSSDSGSSCSSSCD